MVEPNPNPNPDPNQVVVEPADYAEVAATLPGGGPDEALRAKLALKAFCHTACYDTTIAEWMQGQLGDGRTLTFTRTRTRA